MLTRIATIILLPLLATQSTQPPPGPATLPAPVTAPTSQPAAPSAKPLASEHGEAIVRFKPGKGGVQTTHVTFSQEYREKPLVLISESGSSGRFVIAKAEAITPSGFQATARLIDQDDQIYNARLAYVVIGEPLDPRAALAPDRLPSEFGTITLDFEKNKDLATVKLHFRNRYKDAPLVLVGECGSSGTFILVKSERIDRTGRSITARMIDRWASTYRAQVAYLVIGDEVGPPPTSASAPAEAPTEPGR